MSTEQTVEQVVDLSEQLENTQTSISQQQESRNAPIFNIIISFLQANNLQFAKAEDVTVLWFRVKGISGEWTCYAYSKELERQLVLYSFFPYKIKPHKLAAVAEFIARVNYDMMIGNFELNFDTGEVRYKTSVDLGLHIFEYTMLQSLMEANFACMDTYFEGLMKIIYSSISPEEVVKTIECELDAF